MVRGNLAGGQRDPWNHVAMLTPRPPILKVTRTRFGHAALARFGSLQARGAPSHVLAVLGVWPAKVVAIHH
jgi:hypothetical protein